MSMRYQQFDNSEELREYVYQTICDQYQLQLGEYRMTERMLLRGGRPCGIYFTLYGPRMMMLTAIWETDRNQILFYGCDGERFQKTQLTDSPRLERVAA